MFNSFGVLLFTLVLIVEATDAETCLSQAQLAGIVFGVSLITLMLALTIAFVLWWCTRGKRKDQSIIIVEKAPEKAAYENGGLEMEHKATEPLPLQLSDKMTSCHSLKQKHRLRNIQHLHSQRSRSSESLDKLKELMRLAAESRDISPLGFNIQQANGRIFVDTIKENGPADKSGNMFIGDRIKSLNVSFEGMLLEDAIGILSYAAPYKMKLELERTLVNKEETREEEKDATVDCCPEVETGPPRPFRSISLDILLSDDSCEKFTRGGSLMSKQKYALPREPKQSDSVSPASTAPAESIPDSCSESSSSPASSANESSSTLPISAVYDKEISSQSFETTESITDENIIPPALPTNPPPSLSSVSSRTTSPVMQSISSPSKIPTMMPSTTFKASRLPIPKYSPKLALKVEEVQRDGIDEFVEVSRFTFSKPLLSAKRTQHVEFCERLEPKRQSMVVEFKENHPDENASNMNHSDTFEEQYIETIRPERELSPVDITPRMVGVKVETIQSPPKIVERKLPPLPKMIDIPTKDEKNGAALYIEQKESLRRTIVPPKAIQNGVILRKEQRARLDANQSLLERQQEELRALGILP